MKLQKRIKSLGRCKLTFLLAAGFLAVAADDLKVGYREITGVSVESGATATQLGRVDVLPQGRLLKIGGGTLSMPLEAVESRVPTKVEVLDGTLELTADAVAPRDVNNPPSVIAEKAVIEIQHYDDAVAVGCGIWIEDYLIFARIDQNLKGLSL